MTVPFLDLQAQYRSLKDEIDPAIHRVLDTSAYVLGPSVEAFEKAFANYCDACYSIGVNSGTSALMLLLQAYGIKDGDEVITAANSFFATAEAISEVGAMPILVDCEESTALIDPAKIETAVTPKTKAVIPVHLYGQPADMDPIMEIARAHRLFVFEDACQAHGARYKGRRVGGLADGAAFSFYPSKNLGAYGEAGAVIVNDPRIADTIRMLRDHGMPKKYHHAAIGWNERMDGIQGAVLRVKLPHLDTWNNQRYAHARTYRESFRGIVECIRERAPGESVYHLFVIRTLERDALQAHLTTLGIQTGIHYPVPIHLQPAYSAHGWKEGDFPVTERLSREILSLPMFAELSHAQLAQVCEAVTSFRK